ncbi:sialidase family protein [Streptomyces sp. NRRL F-5135]|uniref:sialidase family protein n=1 Tax=Streptomyces sp. NRRL F-5135 TaxID=1463858 RepID=UPI00068DACD5|nr:exo-alpha-sialidase [Streptomyces sp. NRRL F-5135]
MPHPLSEPGPPDPDAADGVVRPRPDEPGRAEARLTAPGAAQNHAANLTVLPGGDLGCVWFGGTQEGVADISVWFSRLPPGGDTWSAPVRLSDDPGCSEQNPVLFPTPSGELWLLHTAQRAGHQDTAEVRRRISLDNGATWGPATVLFPATAEGGVFVRQPVTVLESGRWLLPVFRCVRVPGQPWDGGHDISAVLVSDDAGRGWRERPVPGSTGLVHMNVHAGADGALLALFRSRRADAVHRSTSPDGGETWTVPRALPVPNNNSSLQFVPLGDGRLALAHNPSSAADATARRVSLYDEIDDEGLADAAPARTAEAVDSTEAGGSTPTSGSTATAPEPVAPAVPSAAFWGAPRAPLSLSVSADGGLTWPVRRDLATGDGYCLTNNSRDGLNRELSYPTVTRATDGTLHVAYTHHRNSIAYVRLAPEWVARHLSR